MNLIYFYDFETTGFPLWAKPSSDPGQPHIVQCAAVMVDADTRETIQSFDLIAKPDGWDIPEEVAKIHGITTEGALAAGLPEELVISALLTFHSIASLRIGHNQPFDARIMRIALKRFKRFASEAVADDWRAGESFCTQSASTPICKLPPSPKMLAAGRNGNKTANLGEAYQHFMGKPMENAHTAMGDVLATMAVYWAIQDMECAANPASEDKTSTPTPVCDSDGVGFLVDSHGRFR